MTFTELFYQAFYMSMQNLSFYEDSVLESTENDDYSDLQNTDEVNSAPDTEENLEITPGLGSLNCLKSIGSEDDQSNFQLLIGMSRVSRVKVIKQK